MNDDDPVVCGLEWAIRALGAIVFVLAVIMLATTIGRTH